MVIVITLNYNQNEYTLKCVESILQSTYINYKLLLVDNGSTDVNFKQLSKAIPNDDHLELLRIEKNCGYVGGINFGLTESKKFNPNYVMIMNNDTILDKYGIENLVKTCSDYNNKAIITGKVYYYDRPKVFQDIGWVFTNKKTLEIKRVGLDETDTGQYDIIEERDLMDDVFWLFPSKLYEEIGGYSPYFWFSAEQADFALRAKRKGYKLIYTPEAKLWHKGSVSFGGRGENPKLAYWHTQSTLIFRFRHLSTFQFLKQYLKTIKSIIASYIKAIKNKYFKGKDVSFKYANAKMSGFWYFNKWLFIRNNNKGINPFN
ncbi:MAG: glycosyltransferase [Flavobacteriaceae bacterium]|nr:glycosyltransferase [Flavobacteriaceae bacterium]